MLALHPPPIENQGPRYGQEADTESTAISWPYGTGVADSLRVPHRLKTPGEKGHHSGQVVLEYQLWEAAFKVKPTIPAHVGNHSSGLNLDINTRTILVQGG